MATPKKILIQDLESSTEEIARLREENKKLRERIAELERIVKELIEYKQDARVEKVELIDWQITPVWYYKHEYKAQFLDKEQDDE